MAKVITISRKFPAWHPRKGEPTWFVEAIWQSMLTEAWLGEYMIELSELLGHANEDDMCYVIKLNYGKYHTIRDGKRWKDGDMASLRVWSGIPYGKGTTQIPIAPDVKLKVLDVEIDEQGLIKIAGKEVNAYTVAENDGLSLEDLKGWFAPFLPFSGQVLIWNDSKLNYQ